MYNSLGDRIPHDLEWYDKKQSIINHTTLRRRANIDQIHICDLILLVSNIVLGISIIILAYSI